MHKGSLYATSEGEGMGCQFIVELPLKAAEKTSNQPTHFSNSSSSRAENPAITFSSTAGFMEIREPSPPPPSLSVSGHASASSSALNHDVNQVRMFCQEGGGGIDGLSLSQSRSRTPEFAAVRISHELALIPMQSDAVSATRGHVQPNRASISRISILSTNSDKKSHHNDQESDFAVQSDERVSEGSAIASGDSAMNNPSMFPPADNSRSSSDLFRSVQQQRVSNLHFMVVDDSKLNRKAVTRLLTVAGHSVTEAAGGQEFLNAMAANAANPLKPQVDVVLIDNFMPGMNGSEACEKVRAMGFEGLVVGLTGHVIAEDVDEFMNKGANFVLAKPLVLADLSQIVTNWFSTKGMFVLSNCMPIICSFCIFPFSSSSRVN